MIDVRRRARCAVAALLALSVSAAPGFAATQPYGGGTPEELVARARAAAESGDLGELMACMAPEDRKAMGGTMVMMAVMMVGFSQMGAEMGGAMAEGMSEAFGGEEMSAEQKAELEAQKEEAAAAAARINEKLRAALEPHGLSGLVDGTDPAPGSAEDQALEEALDNADMIALTESVMGVLDDLKEAEGDTGQGMAPDPAAEATPEWVDTEVTDYRVDGDRATAQAGEETLEMIRVDGRWYFAPEPEPETGVEGEEGGGG